MSGQSPMPYGPAPCSPLLRALFPAEVAMMEMRGLGDITQLTPAEAVYVQRAVPKRMQEFAAGRAVARAALAVLGREYVELPAAPDRQPVWPAGFVGSITHTAGFCAAAVARRSQIQALGLDTEKVDAPTPDIWPTICGAGEAHWVNELPHAQRSAAVTVIFSAKEAFYKCQYPLVGEWLDFHDVAVNVLDWEGVSGRFVIKALRDLKCGLHIPLPIGGQFVFHEDYVSAGISVAAGPLNGSINRPCRRETP